MNLARLHDRWWMFWVLMDVPQSLPLVNWSFSFSRVSERACVRSCLSAGEKRRIERTIKVSGSQMMKIIMMMNWWLPAELNWLLAINFDRRLRVASKVVFHAVNKLSSSRHHHQNRNAFHTRSASIHLRNGANWNLLRSNNFSSLSYRIHNSTT